LRGNRLAKVNSVFTSLQHTVMKNKQDKYEPKLNNGKKYGQLNCNFFVTYYLSDLGIVLHHLLYFTYIAEEQQ